MEYVHISSDKAFLAFGGSLGQLSVIDLLTFKIIFTEKHYIKSELTFIYHV